MHRGHTRHDYPWPWVSLTWFERFSIQYRKTKTKVISQPITKDTDYTENQSKLKVIACSRRKAWENACERVTIGFGFTSDWMKNWREFFKPIAQRSKRKTNQLLFDTQMKTALLYNLQLWSHGRWFRKFTVRFRQIRKKIVSSMHNNLFSLDHKRRSHKRNRKKIETFWFFRLRFHRAYDSA